MEESLLVETLPPPVVIDSETCLVRDEVLRGLPVGLGTGLILRERGVTKLPVLEPAGRCLALFVLEFESLGLLTSSLSLSLSSTPNKREELMGVNEEMAQVGYCEVISSIRSWRLPNETNTRTKHSAACRVLKRMTRRDDKTTTKREEMGGMM